MLSFIKELAVTAGTAAVKALVQLVRGKARDGWTDVKVTDPPQPLSHKDVEHQQQQIRSASRPLDLDRGICPFCKCPGGDHYHGCREAGGPHDPALCDLCAEGKCSGFGAPVDRRASTVRPGRSKPGTLPK